MAGPGGMGVPAQPSRAMFDDAERAWSALWQGDRGRAERVVTALGVEEFARLRLLAVALGELTEREWERRRGTELVGFLPQPLDPASAERWTEARSRTETRPS